MTYARTVNHDDMILLACEVVYCAINSLDMHVCSTANHECRCKRNAWLTTSHSDAGAGAGWRAKLVVVNLKPPSFAATRR